MTNRPTNNNNSNKIGTLKESSLHSSLIKWYSRKGDRFEVPIDGYFIDIIRDDTLIEIQTGNFSAIKRKFINLLNDHSVRLVYPITCDKWIIRLLNEEGEILSRRMSPKHERLEYIFFEFVHIYELLNHPNLLIEILFTQEEEIRVNDGKGSWRRKGWSIADRKLLEVTGNKILDTSSNFLSLLPDDLPSKFTSMDISEQLSIPRNLAQKMLFCFRKMGLTTIIGKSGRSLLYTIAITD